MFTVQAYLEDFDKFCRRVGPTTAEVMGEILAVCIRQTDNLSITPFKSVSRLVFMIFVDEERSSNQTETGPYMNVNKDDWHKT